MITEVCDVCRKKGVSRDGAGWIGEMALCQEHYDEILAGFAQAIEMVRAKDGKPEYEQLIVSTITLICPRCGGNEFILLEGGYARIDRVSFKDGKLLLCDYQGFTEDGGGEIWLACVGHNCAVDVKYAIPEGWEINYD